VLASSASRKLAKRHKAGSLPIFIGMDWGFGPRRFATAFSSHLNTLFVFWYEFNRKREGALTPNRNKIRVSHHVE
jgi:hypothetical protein